MKSIFFILTAALSLQLCGNYLSASIITGLCGVNTNEWATTERLSWCVDKASVFDDRYNEILPGSNGIIWLIYVACLIPFTAITGYFFYTHRFYESMKNVAYLLIGALVLNTLVMFTVLAYGAYD